MLTNSYNHHAYAHLHPHPHPHQHQQHQQHPHFDAGVVHAQAGQAQAQAHHSHAVASAYRQRQLPVRAPDLPAGYTHQHQPCQPTCNCTGHHGHPNIRMYADDELAQLQKLSNDFEPEPTGPLVGERQSSSAITIEYANADPVYRIKTAALPSKYAYFRTCRGDGHCGWRAIAFTYYETLIRVGDANKFQDEEVRLESMHNLLNLAGFQPDMYIDWVDEAHELLRKLAISIQNMDGAAPSILLEAFNDLGVSMAIMTYFKLLASAWIQSHPNDFEPFLNMPLKTYVSHHIEAANCEIDNVAVVALAEAIVKPAGFGLQIMYLDRSPGEEINNTYRAEPTSHDGLLLPNPPTMRLLYRPGHYDILYKAEDFPPQISQPVPTQAPLHVALAANYDDFVPMSSNMADVMTMIPGMYPTSIGQRWPAVSYDHYATSAPQPQCTPIQSYAPAPTPAISVVSSHQEYATPVHANQSSHHHPPSQHTIHLEPPVTLPITLPIHPAPSAPLMSIERRQPMTTERSGPFRSSLYELEPDYGIAPALALPFQTSIFRNSHYNTAHFLNPDFQPEEWSPDAEYATGNRGRHKSTSQ